MENVSKEESSGTDLHQDGAGSSYVMCPPDFQSTSQLLIGSQLAEVCGYQAFAICKDSNNQVNR